MMRNRVFFFSVIIAAAVVIALSSPSPVSSHKLMGVARLLLPEETDQTQKETSKDEVFEIDGLQKRGEKKRSKSLRRGSAADILSPGPSSDYDGDYEPAADSSEPSSTTSNDSPSVSTASPPPVGSFA